MNERNDRNPAARPTTGDSARTTIGTTEARPLPGYGALLLTTTLAAQEGLGAYARLPREMTVPGGDRWIVTTEETDGPDGAVRRCVVVIREPRALATDGARARLLAARTEHTTALKGIRSAEERITMASGDAALVARAKADREACRHDAKRLMAEMEALEGQQEAAEPETWRVAMGLEALRF